MSKTGQAGIDLIKEFEGCRLEAYKCPAGVWTIGYGHTAGVKSGDKITQTQAEAYLVSDLKKYEEKVNKYDGKYHWTQAEFDALVSFAYNIGSIDQLTANGTRTKEKIAASMLLYNKAGGRVLAGLTRRRQKENALFLKQDTVSISKAENAAIKEYSLKADGEKSVSRNFKVKEFRCKDGSDKILIDGEFVRNKLQAIRDHFGAPITINSAYRTESWNKKQKGAAKSYHLTGQAFDIVVKGHTPLEVAQYAQTIDIKGIIQYNTFVHVDSRSTRYWARNDDGNITPKQFF
ncbi:MAG: D-Ala-D-Ala carboxypeptidase family metallohydrolase [Roseburia sp.]|nr:D-Ala-D-Ala carboxypeptidase family metallohydrolase [Roseburia sp.]